MDYTHVGRKRVSSPAPSREAPSATPSMEALRTGAAAPTREQMGRRVDLPDAMREKMESAFGADLSAVKLYESEAVAEAGANAVTRGANIAFAPGMLDFTSFGGQALLGHELSHVVSQARGEVSGGGFLNDASLEARADREGAMAASGQTVSLPTAAMSGVTAASAAGPMQADKAEEKAKKHQDAQVKQYLTMIDLENADPKNYTRNKKWQSAARSARSARKWEDYWNDKRDADAEDRGSLRKADRGTVGLKLLEALKEKHSTEEDGLDYDAYRKDAETGMRYMHRSDNDLLSRLDLEMLMDQQAADPDSDDRSTFYLANSLREHRLANLSRKDQKEWARLNLVDGAWEEADRKRNLRYAPMQKQLREDRKLYRDNMSLDKLMKLLMLSRDQDE